jgi:hypothetical protein
MKKTVLERVRECSRNVPLLLLLIEFKLSDLVNKSVCFNEKVSGMNIVSKVNFKRMLKYYL